MDEVCLSDDICPTVAEGKNFAALSSSYTPEDGKISPTTQILAHIERHISTHRRCWRVPKLALSAVSFLNHCKLEYIPKPFTSFPTSAKGELLH